jgi:hypothetical protein
MARLDRAIGGNTMSRVITRPSRLGIRLSGSGGGIFLPSSSSGLARGSLHAHSAPIRATCRAATDVRVKPEHDDRGNVRSYADLNPMRMRSSHGMTSLSWATTLWTRTMTRNYQAVSTC